MNRIANPVKTKKPKKKSVAASIVSQTRAKSAATSNVVLLDEKRFSSTKLERGVDDTGKPYLKALFANPKGKPFEHNLSYMLYFPNLIEPCSLAFLEWGSALKNITRIDNQQRLKAYFFTFLKDTTSTDIGFHEFDEQLFAAFKKWMDAPRNNDQPLAPSTRQKTLSKLRYFFGVLEHHPKWASVARRVVEAIPTRVYRGAHKKIDPTEILNLQHLTAIIKAAEQEFMELQERWAEGRKLLEKGHIELASGSRRYRDLATCLAALDVAYPGVIADIKVIHQDNASLANAIGRYHGNHKLRGYLYPTARDLVPLVLLITIIAVFNIDTTLTLVWSNIEEDLERLGTPAIKVTGTKGRAADDQVRLLDASTDGNKINVPEIFNLLHSMTARIRNSISVESHKDRLFVFVQQAGPKQPKSFGYEHERDSASSDVPWEYGVKQFRKKHGLEYFTPKQLRPTLLDMVQYLSGNLADAQAVGGHKNPHTTWTFYTSSGIKKRYEEGIGQVIVLRERWYTTDGVIDPRQRSLEQDKGAATPGFMCLDPYDSPLPNQKKGLLCKAYGACPSCPLAAANVGEPATVALYLALKRAIYQSQGNMAPKTWLLQWAPVIDDLNALLEKTPEAILAEANTYSLTFPLVG